MRLAPLDVYASDARVNDDCTIHIRPIRADDLDRMLDMWSRLSPEAIRLRFFSPRSMDEREMRYFTEVDYERRFALVAETAGRIVGVSHFDVYDEDPTVAEFAVLVEDAEQGRGFRRHCCSTCRRWSMRCPRSTTSTSTRVFVRRLGVAAADARIRLSRPQLADLSR
ncbi:MAG: hypothetical protein GEU81_11130 [Nitriliruptorales bacterium]|nr:hypothetical protein [Nitriliruptorales bacterium]